MANFAIINRKNDQTYKYSLDPVRYSDNVLEGKEFPKNIDLFF